MKKNIITLVAISLSLSGCGIYTKYKPATVVPDHLYGEEVVAEDTASLGNMDWRELFTDPYLQSLIEVGLQTNTDYQSAQLRVEQAQAALMSAKLAFLPAFALSPQGTVSSFDTQGYAGLFIARYCQLGAGRIRSYAQCQKTGESTLCSKRRLSSGCPYPVDNRHSQYLLYPADAG